MNFKSMLVCFCVTLLVLQENHASNTQLQRGQYDIAYQAIISDADDTTQESETEKTSKRRKKLAYYLLGGVAVGTCLLGIYYYVKNSNQQNVPNPQVPLNPQSPQNVQNLPVQQPGGSPQAPQILPQDLPVHDNEQNDIRILIRGAHGPDINHLEQEAENLFRETLGDGRTIDQAIQVLMDRYAEGDPNIRLHIHYEAVDGHGYLTELDGIYP